MNLRTFIIAIFLGLAIIFSPLNAENSASPQTRYSDLKSPISFSGKLPSASGEGIIYRLNLLPHNVFYLSNLYVGHKEGENRFDDIGVYTQHKNILTLHGGKEGALYFEIAPKNHLKKRDIEGKPIASKLNHSLKRDQTYQPIAPRLFMHGMFSYMADAGVFHNCLTHQNYSVATQADNLELERAYLDTQRTINAPMMVLIEGEIQQRPNMEGPLHTLIVRKFLRIETEGKCKD